MNLTVLQENLIVAIQDANHFISHKTQLPILTGIALRASEGQLTLQATDLRMGYQTSVGAKVEEAGECVVAGKVIGELLSSLSAGPLTLTLEKDILHIKQGSVKAKIPTFNVTDFPPFPVSANQPIALPKETFLNLTNNVLYAASLDETRPILASMLMLVEDGSATFVCTDGYRLAVAKQEKVEGIADLKILLPAKAVNEVVHVLGRSNVSEVRFDISSELSQAFFYVGDTIILVRLVEGEFPPFTKVIPAGFAYETLIDRSEWINSLKTALVFARESSSIVTLKFEMNACKILSSGVNVGENETAIESSTECTEPRQISFNGKFLLDCLTHLTSSRVKLQMNDELKPGVVTPEGQGYPLCVVMPFKR